MRKAPLYGDAIRHLLSQGAAACIVQEWSRREYRWRHWEGASCAMMERYGGKRGKYYRSTVRTQDHDDEFYVRKQSGPVKDKVRGR